MGRDGRIDCGPLVRARRLPCHMDRPGTRRAREGGVLWIGCIHLRRRVRQRAQLGPRTSRGVVGAISPPRERGTIRDSAKGLEADVDGAGIDRFHTLPLVLSAISNAGGFLAAGVRFTANPLPTHRRKRKRFSRPMRVRVVVDASIGIMVVVLVIGMPFTTVPPPVVTTPEAAPLVSIGLGLVVGIGVGTAVPGASVAGAGVTTVQGVAGRA